MTLLRGGLYCELGTVVKMNDCDLIVSTIYKKEVQVQCCFTSTETVGTIRDWEPKTPTWTFTQLPSSEKRGGGGLHHL